MSVHAAEVNRLTTAWLERWRGTGVLSGAGLWPLLAVLAASADEPGRSELADAAGVPADEAMDAARDVLKALADFDGVDAALGLWAQAKAQVRPDWRSQLPSGTFGELTGNAAVDQPKLDQWASERTGGLIEHFPVQSGPQLMLTLATALALRTTWQRTFTDEPLTLPSGPWAGRQLAGLSRTVPDVDDLRVAATPAGALTVTRVAGGNGLDVHLVLGEEGRGVSEMLSAAVAVATEDGVASTGSEVLASGEADPWPGVSFVSATRESLALKTVRFAVRSEHDLMQHAATFGLRTVSNADEGHFSSIGPVPLRVDEARQSAVAIFTATGFEAAAVTAVGLRTVSLPVYRARGLAVSYDRPFGFLAVHRESGIVLFAGWVDAADAWTPPSADESSPRAARPVRPLRDKLPRHRP